MSILSEDSSSIDETTTGSDHSGKRALGVKRITMQILGVIVIIFFAYLVIEVLSSLGKNYDGDGMGITLIYYFILTPMTFLILPIINIIKTRLNSYTNWFDVALYVVVYIGCLGFFFTLSNNEGSLDSSTLLVFLMMVGSSIYLIAIILRLGRNKLAWFMLVSILQILLFVAMFGYLFYSSQKSYTEQISQPETSETYYNNYSTDPGNSQSQPIIIENSN